MILHGGGIYKNIDKGVASKGTSAQQDQRNSTFISNEATKRMA